MSYGNNSLRMLIRDSHYNYESFARKTVLHILIHSADPQSRPVVITIFTHVVRLSVCQSVPTFQNLAKQNNFQVRIVIATGHTVVWPRGSLTTPVLFLLFPVNYFRFINWDSLSNQSFKYGNDKWVSTQCVKSNSIHLNFLIHITSQEILLIKCHFSPIDIINL